MSLQLENLIKPFVIMTDEEQLTLIRKVRHNRYIVRDSKVKTAARKNEKKQKAKSYNKVKEISAALPPEERKKLLLKMQEQQNGEQ